MIALLCEMKQVSWPFWNCGIPVYVPQNNTLSYKTNARSFFLFDGHG
jgi:hypothetical protein